MEGTDSAPGVNVRALSHLFSLLASKEEYEWKVKFQAVEIYNETPRDLLLPPSSSSSSSTSDPKLEIHQNPDGSMHIPLLSSKIVKDEFEVQQLMAVVKGNRVTQATSMNEYSSRSHSLTFLHIEGLPREAGEERITSRLVLIDLAGSERLKKSQAEGQAFKEATYINKSLLALGDVISALKAKQPFIPFRNSKLTYLLSDVLGGQGKVLLFAQISPSVSDAQESACTLQFAQKARSVQLGAKQKQAGSSKQGQYTKLLKLEASLSEKESTAEKLALEARSAREELAAERSLTASKLAAAQLKEQEKVKALEELAQERAAQAMKLAAAQSKEAERVRALEAELAAKRSEEEASLQQIQALLRAKEKEVMELKMQRTQAVVAPSSSLRAPRLNCLLSSPCPVPFAADLTSPPRQQLGVNLLDVTSPLFQGKVEVEGGLFQSVDEKGRRRGGDAEDMRVEDLEQEHDENEKENGSTGSGKKRWSGSKRKELDGDEADAQSKDENPPASKKARTLPSTPVSKILAPLSLTSNIPVPVAGLKKTAGLKAVAKQLTPRAKKTVAVNAAAAAMDVSFDSAELLSTPVGKTVRFGETSTKFISPSPSPLAQVHASLIVAPANLDALRVKARGPGVKSVGGIFGGAKRHVVKQQEVKWNSSFKK
jgi:hypothetical protein